MNQIWNVVASTMLILCCWWRRADPVSGMARSFRLTFESCSVKCSIAYMQRVNSVRYGTEKICFLAPKIWDILPKDVKDSESLDIFKRKIKNWIPSEYPCSLRKTYVLQVGFIWVVKIKDIYHLLSWRQLAFQ